MGVEAAVVDRVAYPDVSVQGDGAQVHDGGGGEQHVQVDPDGTQGGGEGPGVVWRRRRKLRWRRGNVFCSQGVNEWTFYTPRLPRGTSLKQCSQMFMILSHGHGEKRL